MFDHSPAYPRGGFTTFVLVHTIRWGCFVTEGTSMLVAEQRSVEWEVTGLSSLDATGSGTIQVRVTNTGNTALSHQLTLETSKGLNAVIVGEDIVNAVAGDSQQFTIQLSGTSTGTQQLTFALDGVQAVDSSTSRSALT